MRSPGPTVHTTGIRCRSTRTRVSSTCPHRTSRSTCTTTRTGQPTRTGRANRTSNLAGTPRFANAKAPASKPFGRLIAWDPIARNEAWRQEQVSPWNGGTLTSAGNLVFQGTADGRFLAYNATTGQPLWTSHVGTGIVAAPVTYLIDDTQYVSIAVGWGGVYGLSQRASDEWAGPRLHLRARR